MKKYLLKRILLIVPTFLGITLITYSLVRLAPGDFTSLRLDFQGGLRDKGATEKFIIEERKLYGLDKPIIVGYGQWLLKFVTLDMGNSRKDGRPVTERIADALPITITLDLISIIIIYTLSIPIGIYSAVRKDSAFDRWSAFGLFILYSLPDFWIALLLLMYLGGGEYLNLFPLGGISSDWADQVPRLTWFLDRVWHLVLPVVTYTYGSLAFLSRYTRANMLEVINQQYIATARAKGLSERRVIFVHAFRNSLIPLITLMAMLLPGLIGGSVIVEQIFSIPGMGMLAFEALKGRDLPVIMAITAIAALLTLVSILIADLLYAVADPRIRLEAEI